MELLGRKELTITQDSLKYAGIIAAKIKDINQRKRAYASIIALDVFSDELVSQGFNVNINKNLFKIAPINEEFEITDIYCNNWKIDVRVACDDYVLIPKSHFTYDIAADFYVVVKMDKTLKKAALIGYVSKDEISKTKSVDDYYVIDFSALKEFAELTEKIKTPNDKLPASMKHDSFREAYLSFLDGDLDYVRKKDMIKHLRDCEECRADFVEFFDFEVIVSKSKNFPAIFNDQTLDFIGGAAAENSRYDGKEEIIQINESSVDNQAGQIVSDLFGAAIATGLASDIPIAAAAAGALSSAAINELSNTANNFEDILDGQISHSGGEDSHEDSQSDNFIEFYDGETEDSIAQEEDNVINFDEESVINIEDEDISTSDELLQEDDTDYIPNDVEETESSVGMIDFESDEILDSDLDNILDEDDIVQDEAQNDDDFSFSELDDSGLFDEDLKDGLDFLEEIDEEETTLKQDFVTVPADIKENIIGDVNEGVAIPDSVSVETLQDEDNQETFGYHSEESNQDTEENDDEIQFIDSISDVKPGVALAEENESTLNLSYDDVVVGTDSDDDIQFINSAQDIRLKEEDKIEQEDEEASDNVEDPNPYTLVESDDEITFIDDSQSVPLEEEKQKYQGMFNYNDTLVIPENNANAEVIADVNSLPAFNNVSSSFAEAMNNSDDDDIETLYSSPSASQNINIPQIPQAVQGMQESSVDTKRLIILASAIAGSLLVVSIVGFLMFSNINKNKTEQFNDQVNQVDSLDTNMNNGAAQEQADSGYVPPPAQVSDNMNVTTTTPKDMNKTMTNVFDENASSVTVTKISWEVAKPVAQNQQIARYLQLAGKNIVINLKKNLLNATEFSYNDSAKVFISIGKDNNIKALKIVTSSGSEQIDEIVLQSIKETLTYINVPVLADSVQKELGPNAYTYKLVINF